MDKKLVYIEEQINFLLLHSSRVIRQHDFECLYFVMYDLFGKTR